MYVIVEESTNQPQSLSKDHKKIVDTVNIFSHTCKYSYYLTKERIESDLRVHRSSYKGTLVFNNKCITLYKKRNVK